MKALATKPGDLRSKQRHTQCKEWTYFHRLSSDLHTQALACTHLYIKAHTYINNFLKKLGKNFYE